MKHTIKYYLIGLALTACSVSVSAQSVTENGITTKKTVTPNSSGKYNVELEINANGESSATEPVTSDIVLVLDVSGSMDEQLGTPEALASTSYSYDSFGNNTYYYKDGNNYWPVYRGTGRANNTDYYYLYYYTHIGSNYQKYFLYTNNNGTTGTAAFEDNGIGSNDDFTTTTSYYNQRTILNTTRAKTSRTATLYTGVLYKGTRMDALKSSVNNFIQKLKENSAKLPSGYDNQISIIKFGLENTNSLYYGGGGNQILYNNVSIVADFTALTEDGATTLTGIVNNFIPGGGTGANLGLTQALNQFNNSSLSEKSKKTVVLFTDGAPDNYYTPINVAKQLKDKGIKVYTVGIFDNETDAIRTYMNGVSSNYPDAVATPASNPNTTSLGSRNTDTDEEGNRNEYYFTADSQEGLEAIFATLAAASGSSEQQVGASSQVRDVVASSFTLPDNMTASQISYKVMKISRDGESWSEDTEYDKSGIKAEFGKKSYIEDGKTIQKDTIGVTGFDYSKDDTTVGQGDGNWVGNRIPDPTDRTKDFIAGRKLVISFVVEAKEGVTGGDSMTNGEGSGVYVLNAETGEYECKNHFYLPETQLPINIMITKTGLRHGESATFKIMKIAPRKDADGNIVYNALGKPVPNETEPVAGESDPYKAVGWKNFSKVILTNKGADGTNRITKTLLNLDPNWVYLVIEDDWAWSYETKGAEKMQTTSSVPVNPFSFTNKEKTGVVKHAEAVMINHFATSEAGEADVEHYKSSKVESF